MEDCAYVGIECAHERRELAQLRPAAAGLAGSDRPPCAVSAFKSSSRVDYAYDLNVPSGAVV